VYAPSSALAPAIGRRLARADAQWHVIAGKPDSLIRFWLTFEEAGTFGFHVGEAAPALEVLVESVDIDADMARYGRLEVRPAVTPDPPALAVGQRLLAVEDVRVEAPAPATALPAAWAQAPTAARLRFESVTICAADHDDDLCWSVGDLPVGSGS
jgi:hypothetical protein